MKHLLVVITMTLMVLMMTNASSGQQAQDSKNPFAPLKKKRSKDDTQDSLPMPDRAIIVYCNALRRYFNRKRCV